MDRDSVCPSVVITALSEFKIKKTVMQSTEPQGSRLLIDSIAFKASTNMPTCAG